MIPFIVIPFDVLNDDRLTLRQLRVLCALFSHRDPKSTNVVFPSRDRLSKMTGYIPQRVSAITRELSELGWVVKIGDGGRGNTVRYRLSETVPDSEKVPILEKVPELSLNGTQNGTEKVPELGTHNGIDNRIDQNIPFVGKKIDKKFFEIPPKQEDAEEYGLKIGMLKEEVLAFMDHHAMNGWIMKNGKKMVDWEAGMRTWQRSPYRKLNSEKADFKSRCHPVEKLSSTRIEESEPWSKILDAKGIR